MRIEGCSDCCRGGGTSSPKRRWARKAATDRLVSTSSWMQGRLYRESYFLSSLVVGVQLYSRDTNSARLSLPGGVSATITKRVHEVVVRVTCRHGGWCGGRKREERGGGGVTVPAQWETGDC